MTYARTYEQIPEPLEDVIGLVKDGDCLTQMLVYRRANGRFYASQTERDIELNVVAWAPMPAVQTDLIAELGGL